MLKNVPICPQTVDELEVETTAFLIQLPVALARRWSLYMLL